MDFIAILTGFGVGSAITALIQNLLTVRTSARRRAYDERKEAYLGLTESWVRQEQEGTTSSNQLEVGHWHLRCQFVAPDGMISLLGKWAETEPGCMERIAVTKQLKTAMRNDLSNFR